jgi:O-methyltransferase
MGKLGLEIHRAPNSRHPASHAVVRPFATYAPWIEDAAFRVEYDRVKSSTLVDEYRCYELWQLVAQASKLPAGALLEVGVWRGGTGVLIGAAALRYGIREPVYLCDTFRGVVKASAADSSYKGSEHGDTSRQTVQNLAAKLALTNVRVLEGVFPDETGAEVDSPFLRFVHVDVDVYESARGVSEWAWPRLVHGGLVVYDDYGFASCDGVTRAVNKQRGQADRIVFHNLNGHAVVIKL